MKINPCILHKTCKCAALFYPPFSPWVLALPERSAWSWKPNTLFIGHENNKWFQRKPHLLCFKLWKCLYSPEMEPQIPLCKKKPIFLFASFLTNTDYQPENIHVRYKRDGNLQYKPWMLSSIILKIHIKGTGWVFLFAFIVRMALNSCKNTAEFTPVN